MRGVIADVDHGFEVQHQRQLIGVVGQLGRFGAAAMKFLDQLCDSVPEGNFLRCIPQGLVLIGAEVPFVDIVQISRAGLEQVMPQSHAHQAMGIHVGFRLGQNKGDDGCHVGVLGNRFLSHA